MNAPVIAYFSMEIGLESSIPTYAGGLGILAGDTIRSAADMEVPMVAVTLLHRQGYFQQRLDPQGQQWEEPVVWSVEDFLEPQKPRVTVTIEGRPVRIQAWCYQVDGVSDFQVPVYLLDTDLEENSPQDRRLTDVLYGGDASYRLRQETVLGLGGVRMLRALGYEQIIRFHMNEGHSALLALALLEEYLTCAGNGLDPTPKALEAVRNQCIFTTHTPVPAGHDQFPADLAHHILGAPYGNWLRACGQVNSLNMTDLALHCSRFINGVALKHGAISRGLFPDYPIHSITNGVHHVTWTSPAFKKLYDQYLPGWRRDAFLLRYAVDIPGPAIWDAHQEAKGALLAYVNQETNSGFAPEVLTLGFARRATPYKRTTLLFRDLARLRAIAEHAGPFQVIFAGKAHPHDQMGKDAILQVHEARNALQGVVRIAYLPGYSIEMGKLLCAGVDIWLNTPRPPHEASGTSGMKAVLNGIPSLSVLDGWWIEGHIEGATGWAIGDLSDASRHSPQDLDARHATALYEKLGHLVLPCFYKNRHRFIEIMRQTITLNGAFFNTQRMVWQYLHNAYRVNHVG